MLIQRVIVAGGSGLVGSAVLEQLISDTDFIEVHAVVRRPITDAPPRIRQHIVDFAKIAEWEIWKQFDEHPVANTVILCCLGTTLDLAGSEEQYRRVDHDIPIELGRVGLLHGVNHFVAISSAGLNKRAPNHFMRAKIDLERDLKDLGYRSLSIVRPSLILGQRTASRPLEKIAAFFMRPLSIIIPPRWRAVHDWQVARAMIEVSMDPHVGVQIIPNERIATLKN